MKRWPKQPEFLPGRSRARLALGYLSLLLLAAVSAPAQPAAEDIPLEREAANRAFRLQHYAESRTHLLRILAVDPQDDEVRFQTFLTYLLEGKEEPTRDYLNLLVDPGLPSYHLSRAAWSLAKGDYAAADYFVVAVESLFPPQTYLPYEALLQRAAWPEPKPEAKEPRYESLLPAGTILEESIAEPDDSP